MSELTKPAATPRWVSELASPPPVKSKTGAIPDPPGFPAQGSSGTGNKASPRPTSRYTPDDKRDAGKDLAKAKKPPPTAEEMDTLKLKKAWEVALAPVKSLPMTFIMMYMSGNSLQIFSIMMVFMAFKNPVVGLAATNQAFERFETDSNRAKMVQVKLAYVAMQLVALAVGVWKVNTMGLLPTTRSDWLAWEVQREPLESAAVAL